MREPGSGRSEVRAPGAGSFSAPAHVSAVMRSSRSIVGSLVAMHEGFDKGTLMPRDLTCFKCNRLICTSPTPGSVKSQNSTLSLPKNSHCLSAMTTGCGDMLEIRKVENIGYVSPYQSERSRNEATCKCFIQSHPRPTAELRAKGLCFMLYNHAIGHVIHNHRQTRRGNLKSTPRYRVDHSAKFNLAWPCHCQSVGTC